MRNFKRVIFYLLLNVIVSASTTWLVITVMLNFGFLTNYRLTDMPSEILATPIYDPMVVEVVVSDVVNISNLIGAGDLENEYVEIQHVGEDELSLEGWKLVDEQNFIFTFPGLTLHSGGVVRVYTKAGPLSAIELYWGLDGAIWASGERVVLLDAGGEPRSSFEVP